MSALSKSVMAVFSKYPIVRGMVSYGVSWPVSSFIQQTIEGKRFGMSTMNASYIVKL